MSNVNGISIIVPILNEEENIGPLIQRVHKVIEHIQIPYEVIIIDDHSTDKTQHIIQEYLYNYPVVFRKKKGISGKAQSLLEGFSYAHYDLLCMIDGDLQYPPEAIPEMIAKIEKGFDVIVSKRKTKRNRNIIRMISTSIFSFVFSGQLHNLKYDVQSGLKVFKKEIIERLNLQPQPWSFDLEFLLKARHAGYKIGEHEIEFSERKNGKTKVHLLKTALQLSKESLRLKFADFGIIPFHPKQKETLGEGFHYNGRPFVPHTLLHIDESALFTLDKKQKMLILLAFVLLLLNLIINFQLSIILIVAVLTAMYFSDLLFNLFLIIKSFLSAPEVTITNEEIENNTYREWPIYTIFCPLYKEWEVLPQFITSISKLDYPKEKLQVILLLEEDDTESIKHINGMTLPFYFEVVIVPDTLPKTKPKACNYGLRFAKGDYCVIYDAEDAPNPDQLKKAIIAFEKSDSQTICMQAKLNYYNTHQNILTRVFTAEYSLWFDLILTGLQSINAPIPLGGTSNHFKREVLDALDGWDAFNVTEDCDLGIRLVKKGYKTAIIDSTTLEEANSELNNWVMQRSRWIKGYIQTYLVHMRNPSAFISSIQMLMFQLIVGGKIISLVVNPLMWFITITYFAARPIVGETIEKFFPGPILYIGVFSFIFGNFLYLYYYMIGCARKNQYHLIKYVYLVPFYWIFMSMAAWVAFYKLITAPHQWFKTKHGLHLRNKKAIMEANTKLGRNLIDIAI